MILWRTIQVISELCPTSPGSSTDVAANLDANNLDATDAMVSTDPHKRI